VQYDPEKIAPGAMLEMVARQEFQATIVPDES
jgi:hypothetical protein